MSDHDNPRPPPRSRSNIPRIVIAVVVLGGLFWFWSDERGQNSWENYKQGLAVRGESLDWKDYLPPPPPPDEENFAATRLLRAVGVKGKVDATVWGRFQALGLESQVGKLGDWMNGRRAELKSIQDYLRSNGSYSLPDRPRTAPADILMALEPVRIDLDELRDASTRPYAKLQLNYPDPVSADIPNFIALRVLAQSLSLKASANLALGRTDEAFGDIRVIHRLANTAEPEPNLVSVMISVAIHGLELQTFWEGWIDRQWSDEQLAEFQRRFAAVDLPSVVDRGMRGERAGITTFVEHSDNRTLARNLNFGGTKTWNDRLTDLGIRVASPGLRYRNLLNYNRLLDRTFLNQWDEAKHRVNPSRVRRASQELQSALSSSKPLQAPFNYLSSVAIPNFTRAFEVTTRTQTSLNEALLVCALERYRRAHGQYPASLDALVPGFVRKLPPDLIGGQPLKYRSTEDGKFLLYSVGWNERDDGGNPDKEKGDWVWPAAVME